MRIIKVYERRPKYMMILGFLKEISHIVATVTIIILAALMIRAALAAEARDTEIDRLGDEAATLSDAIDATLADMIAETRGPVPATREPIAAEPAPLPYTDAEIDMLARTVWAEARGCAPEEQALVVWTVLQRVDADAFPDTIEDVILQKNQFLHDEGFPLRDDIRALCLSEAGKWAAGESAPTHPIYAPTHPYYYFGGDGKHNYFHR
jgi:hypothetical protein